VGALLNFGVAIIVSQMTAKPPPEVDELVEYIRYP
jgi:Na+(H+)/acetate symporter ActP